MSRNLCFVRMVECVDVLQGGVEGIRWQRACGLGGPHCFVFKIVCNFGGLPPREFG